MTDTFLATASCTANLIAMVHSSLETVRKMLVGGRQNEETNAQVRQLELLEQLLLDQDARLDLINKVLEEFNYSVAHELCAPLRRISGFTREVMLRCSDEMDPDGINCLNHILESSQQMNDLIDALMQISRLSHGNTPRVKRRPSLNSGRSHRSKDRHSTSGITESASTCRNIHGFSTRSSACTTPKILPATASGLPQ